MNTSGVVIGTFMPPLTHGVAPWSSSRKHQEGKRSRPRCFAYTPKGAIIRLIFAGLLAGLRRHVLGEVGRARFSIVVERGLEFF